MGINTTPVKAKQVVADSATTNNATEITPFALVKNAYQGYFVDQEIPSNSAFLYAIHFDKVDAEKLVKSAIAKGRLSSETLNNKSYLNKVELLLDQIERRR